MVCSRPALQLFDQVSEHAVQTIGLQQELDTGPKHQLPSLKKTVGEVFLGHFRRGVEPCAVQVASLLL
jgi:hypothetical protein